MYEAYLDYVHEMPMGFLLLITLTVTEIEKKTLVSVTGL